jgi:hypothetical protein
MPLETYYLKLAMATDDLTPLIEEVKALYRDAIAAYNEQLDRSIELGLFIDWLKSDTPIIRDVANLRNAVEALQNEANRRHLCNRIF